MIPTEEFDQLTEVVDAAIGLAADGCVGEGYRRLSEGRARADLLRVDAPALGQGPARRGSSPHRAR